MTFIKQIRSLSCGVQNVCLTCSSNTKFISELHLTQIFVTNKVGLSSNASLMYLQCICFKSGLRCYFTYSFNDFPHCLQASVMLVPQQGMAISFQGLSNSVCINLAIALMLCSLRY